MRGVGSSNSGHPLLANGYRVVGRFLGEVAVVKARGTRGGSLGCGGGPVLGRR